MPGKWANLKHTKGLNENPVHAFCLITMNANDCQVVTRELDGIFPFQAKHCKINDSLIWPVSVHLFLCDP